MRHLAWAVLVVAILAGCLSASPADDDAGDLADEETPGVTDQVLPDEISGYREVAIADADGSGNGLWIDEASDTLYATRAGAGLYIYDISDPADPKELAQLVEPARDVDVMHRGNATYALLAAGSDGIHIVDVTNRTDPQLVTTADEWGSHNLAVVPGTPYVYDSTAVSPVSKVQDGGVVPVLDLSNVTDPEWTTFPIPREVNGVTTQSNGCHDVVVRVDLGQAFCAGGGSAGMTYGHGGGETFIWDISDDPTDPEWVGAADHPSIMYHHQAVASHDGDTLLVNDEFIAPNCNRADDVKQSTAAVWVFDISDPSSPEQVGYVQADAPTNVPNCGSHFGDVVADRDVATWGWYGGGSLLIDFAQADQPEILDRKMGVGSVWDARYHDGHAFSNGGDALQVLELV